MGRKRLPPDDPREWISRAKSNMALARNVIPDVDLEDLCFDAQQAADKAIKAVFIHRGETFPRPTSGERKDFHQTARDHLDHQLVALQQAHP